LKRLALLPFLIIASAPALAGENAQVAPPSTARLTLDDALARARPASARLTSLTALTRAASEGVRGARAGRRPDLDLSASYSRNSNVPELILAFPGSEPRVIFPNLPNNWRTHIGASLPLYTGGRIDSQVAAATQTERATASDRAAAEDDLVLETHVAYVNVLFARDNARVLRAAVASYEAHLKDARNRQDLGLSASNEVLAVTVERERAELGRVQAENAAAMATANLLRLVGLPPGTSLELETVPAVSPATQGETDGMIAQALAGRPELEALRARARALDAGARVALSLTRPQAGLQAGFDYANPNPRILPLTGAWNDSWSIGISVNWKVLDGGRADAAAAQGRAQAEAMRAQLADLETRIRLEVTTRQLELESTLAGKVVAQRGIEAARDAVRVAQDRYKEGVLSSTELLDAETRLLRAELDATQTDAQIQVARANLTRAVGR
jgi:outer membrane protein TolC